LVLDSIAGQDGRMPEPLSISTPRVALVGDRSPGVRAHARIPGLLDALAQRDQLVLDAYWIPTQDVESAEVLAGFDAIWLVPGSPYRSEAGAIVAVGTAREQGIPFLGTCGGFQHALLEFARDVCGLGDVDHGENRPEADDLLIVPLACSLVGHEGVVKVAAGSLAERVLGAERTVERYHCSYGLSPAYLHVLRAYGLRFSGVDEAGDVRIAELPDHPFFLATLFQPELAGDGTRPHPIVRAMAAAAVDHAGKGASPTLA
jgi:CTP synthase (UTP-ammonia lyase)